MSLSKRDGTDFVNELDKEGQRPGQRKYPLPILKTKLPWKRNSLIRQDSEDVQQWMKWLKEISGMTPELFNKIKGMGLICAFFYPECDDIQAYELIQKFFILLYIFDDHEECEGGDIDRDAEGAAMIWGQYDQMIKRLEGTKMPMHRWKPYVWGMYATIESIIDGMRTQEARSRFICQSGDYMEGSLEENNCINRAKWPSSLEEMTKTRWKCSAVAPCILAIEFMHGLSLTEKVWKSPKFQRLFYLAVKHVFVYNDFYSFEKEMNDADNNMAKVMFNTVATISVIDGIPIEKALEKTIELLEDIEQEMLALEEQILAESDCLDDTKKFVKLLNLFCRRHEAYEKLDRYN